MIVDSITELVGNTPMIRLNRFNKDGQAAIIGKNEALNPGSSVKDRIALAMIEAAEKSGALVPGSTIIEPTSGNTGIGLAMIAAIKGYRIILTMPASMSIERRKLLISLGAEIVITDANKGMQGAVEKAHSLCDNIDNAFMPQQFNNPANPQVHYNTTGPEIWNSCNGEIDYFVAGIGTGGTITGAGKYLKEKNPKIKIIAVEPEESAVISGEEMGPHMIQGIGAGFIPQNLDEQIIDEVIKINSEAAIDTAKKLSRTEGLMVGISAGGNVAASKIIADRPENNNKIIVTMLCDTSERYISTLLFHED